MKKLIIGAVYKHKPRRIVWEAIGGMELKCIHSGDSGFNRDDQLVIDEDDPIFTLPHIWIIIPPFNKYYEATNK